MSGLSKGSVLGGYQIEGPLGSGGMGVVYRARQLSLDRVVALKVVSPALIPDPTSAERFNQEALLAASLEHPNIVPVYERGESDGHLFIAMRLITGEDLHTRVQRDGPLAPEHAIEVIRQIASALDAAHAAGLVHRDVKPANILLSGDSADVTAYLTDFGIARRHTGLTRLTATGMLVGTPGYVAPEIIRGEDAAPSADIYALGCVLFEALTAAEPFAREDPTLTLAAHLTDPPPQHPGIAPRVGAVIHRALRKSPQDRFERASQLADAARAALDHAVDPETLAVRSAEGAIAGGGERRPKLSTRSAEVVGRSAELDALGGLLRDPAVRLVTLTGPGGIGKTTLARAAAAELESAFADGVFWADLAEATTQLAALTALAQALDVAEAGTQTLLEAVVERLDEHETLLVLDNVEQVPEVGMSLAELVTSGPGVKVLATSRSPLRLTVERDFPVSPLDDTAAIELFQLLARRAGVDLSPGPEIAEICARLDRVPLALELCAARLRMMTPQAILERFQNSTLLSFLPTGPRDAPAHQQTMRATLDWSYALLVTSERELFARLSVFVGGFPLVAAETVCDASLDAIAALIDSSLLRHENDRYSMLRVVAEYAGERLGESSEADLLGERHAEWCLAATERDIQPFLEGREEQAAGWRLAEEHDNVSAGIRFARDSGRGELALRLAHAAGIYWYFSSTNIGVGLSELEATLTTFTSPPAAWAATACSAGWLAVELGRFDDARRHGEAALRLRSEMHSTRVEIETLNLVGACEPDPRRGRAHFEDVISVAQKAGLRTQVMNALMNLGSLAMEQGALVEARERLAEAQEIAFDYSDSHLKPWLELNLAVASALDGDPRSSLSHLSEALHGDTGSTMVIQSCAVMALAAAQLGDHRACARLLGVVDAIRDDTGLALGRLESTVAERAQAISVAALGESFDGEREQGRSTPAGAAAAFALERAEELAMAA